MFWFFLFVFLHVIPVFFCLDSYSAKGERSGGEADDGLEETDSLAARPGPFQGGLKTVPARMPGAGR